MIIQCEFNMRNKSLFTEARIQDAFFDEVRKILNQQPKKDSVEVIEGFQSNDM